MLTANTFTLFVCFIINILITILVLNFRIIVVHFMIHPFYYKGACKKCRSVLTYNMFLKSGKEHIYIKEACVFMSTIKNGTDHNSSCECNIVVSAFLQFCRRGDFVFETLLIDYLTFQR